MFLRHLPERRTSSHLVYVTMAMVAGDRHLSGTPPRLRSAPYMEGEKTPSSHNRRTCGIRGHDQLERPRCEFETDGIGGLDS
jgi:hypothetical protein